MTTPHLPDHSVCAAWAYVRARVRAGVCVCARGCVSAWWKDVCACVCLCVCVCVCAEGCVCARVRASERACVRACMRASVRV